MDINEINAFSNVFIAVSTVLGVAGALSYYFSEIVGFNIYKLLVLEIGYFTAIFFVAYWIKRRI